MKRLISFISLLIILSLTSMSYTYAESHEKKMTDTEKSTEATADDKKKGKKEEEEEPDCE
jgi:hypothetical protein